MKKETVRKRRKQFLALILALVMGMLPAAEVLARSITVDEKTGEYWYDYEVKLDGSSVGTYQGTKTTAGVPENGRFSFFAKSGDTLTVNNSSWSNSVTDKDNATHFINGAGDEISPISQATKPMWQSNFDNTHIITIPGESIYSEYDINNTLGWRVSIQVHTDNASQSNTGKITRIDFLPAVYTINYKNCDGTPVWLTLNHSNTTHVDMVNSGSITASSTLSDPTEVTGSGYSFEGWYASASGDNNRINKLISSYDASSKNTKLTGYLDNSEIESFSPNVDTGAVTIYAKWVQNSLPSNCTVIFNNNDGTGASATQSVAYGSCATAPASPIRFYI